MSIIERRAYTRITVECDNCGKTENAVTLEEEPMDSIHQLPLQSKWIVMPGIHPARKDLTACQRSCADALASQAIDALVATA